MIDEGNMNVHGNVGNLGNVGNGMKFGCGVNQMESGNGFNTRKRSREFCSFDPVVVSFPNVPNGEFVNRNEMNNQKGIFTFLGEDLNFSMQIRQQELEIDRFVAEHTEKMRSEIESARWRITMRVIAAAEEGMKRLRSKEDEVVQIGRLNHDLEQKVKSLTEDNQIWQQMALTNEATANLLRRNLEQILSQFHGGETAVAAVDDGESCCGSNHDIEDKNGSGLKRWCRNCGKEEMCVLVLPCRHLCICTVCESSINFCPICKSTKNATVHLNMNSF